MPATWKSVRVFISSTFCDMHAERDYLVKVTFPALRERLEKYRIYLDDIDLRWGVTREQAENDQVLDLCLQQIDECRPFFIGILGERYGWVPTRYPANALKKFGWIQHHTGKSVTELEILHGVLENRQMRGRAFFYFRDPVTIQPVPESIRRAVYTETDRGQIEKLVELKTKIRDSGYPVMENYPARWDPEANDRPSRSKGRLVDLDEFGQRVHDQLWQAIREEFQLPEQPPVFSAADPLAEEQDYHERFMESRLRVYVGREQINDALLAFADGTDLVPCLVTGPFGSGKSAALARFVRDYQHKQPQTLVIPHFIGASPRSTNLRDMLRRFCEVFKTRFGFTEEVPEEVAKLSVTFREFVGEVPANTRVLLVIDALNQLDEADRAQELYWLPTALPPQVKVIVSCISDTLAPTGRGQGEEQPVLEAFRWRKHCPLQLTALRAAEQRLIIRQVPSLSAKTLDDDQVRLLLSNPATANPLFLLVALEELRGFAPYERLNERIATFPREGDTVTAIFTQVIERLAEEFNQKLVETVLTLLASARRGLSERELQELTAPLATSGRGDGGEGSRDGADDLFPVLRQLRPYLLSRAGLIDFYHRNLFKAVRERYLPSEEQQRQAHVRLADYFHAQDYWLESLEDQRARAKRLPPTPRPANVRKVDELPWQLLQAADWQKSEQLLTELAFLEAKGEAGMVIDLAADFSAAIGGMSADRPLLRILRLLEEAIRRDIHFIARHPTTLFQCMWNSCWWYDCPEAARHYEASEKGSIFLSSPSAQLARFWHWLLRATHLGSIVLSSQSAQLEPKLSTLLESWRKDKETLTRGWRWVRSLRPPTEQLGTALIAVLRGHKDGVTSVACSVDGRRIASGSADKTVRIWESASGAELCCLRGHENEVLCVAFSPDGQRIASGAQAESLFEKADNSIRIWDADCGTELRCLRGHEDAVSSVAFSPDGRHLASGAGDSTVRIWDVATGSEKCSLRHPFGGVQSVAFSPDGHILASAGAGDKTVRLWDATSGRELRCLLGHKRWVQSVAFSPDGRHVVSGADDSTIRIWDATSGAERHCLYGHGPGGVQSVAYSNDGRRIVSGGFDRTVRVWDSASGAELRCLRGHEDMVKGAVFSPGGRHIVSAADDKTLRVWDADRGAEPRELRGHKKYVRSVVFSPDGQLIVSGGDDRTVRVWDARDGTELHCLPGHGDWVLSVAISPDNRRIASSSGSLPLVKGDNSVRVWDAASGAELFCLRGHEAAVQQVAFSPDGRRMISQSDNYQVRVWDAADGTCLDVFENSTMESAAAGGAPSAPWRAVVSELETVIESADTGERVACFPLTPRLVSGDPPDPKWAGAVGNYLSGNYLCLFILEGAPERYG